MYRSSVSGRLSFLRQRPQVVCWSPPTMTLTSSSRLHLTRRCMSASLVLRSVGFQTRHFPLHVLPDLNLISSLSHWDQSPTCRLPGHCTVFGRQLKEKRIAKRLILLVVIRARHVKHHELVTCRWRCHSAESATDLSHCRLRIDFNSYVPTYYHYYLHSA